MWLATQLYTEGRISGDEFASASVEQIQRRKPLGQIALQNGMLTMKQIMQIVGEQAIVSELPFGEVAIRLKLLTAEQVAELLYLQAQNVPTLEEVMVELGSLTQQELNEAQQGRSAYYKDVDLPAVVA